MSTAPFPTLLAASTLALLGCACAGAASRDIHPATDPEARLAALGLDLPATSSPLANYVKVVRSGDHLYLSGHGPQPLEPHDIGQVPTQRTLEEAQAAARKTTLNMLATLKAELGDLHRVHQVVRVFGMVNASPDFADHSKVLNGCSDLLVEVFGERGRHARAAVGVASLPMGMVVEIEMIVSFH